MPKIPDGAKTPADHKQSENVKPPTYPEGWELLREPMDIEFWEETEFLSALAEVKSRGEMIELTAKNIRAIGNVVRIMQTVFAKDSAAFRAWVKKDTFENATVRLLPLLFAYANALGEVDSSTS